jgi:hypothetical protein
VYDARYNSLAALVSMRLQGFAHAAARHQSAQLLQHPAARSACSAQAAQQCSQPAVASMCCVILKCFKKPYTYSSGSAAPSKGRVPSAQDNTPARWSARSCRTGRCLLCFEWDLTDHSTM